jgi:hypothetical protein
MKQRCKSAFACPVPFLQPANELHLSVSWELAIPSSGGDLELLFLRHVLRVDVSRENGLKGDDISRGTPLEIFPNKKKRAPPIRTSKIPPIDNHNKLKLNSVMLLPSITLFWYSGLYSVSRH